MNPLATIVLCELRRRSINALLSFVAVLLAVALVVALWMTLDGQERETRRLMLGLGRNLRIVSSATDLGDLYTRGWTDTLLDEASVHTLARAEGLSYNHLSARLDRPIRIGDDEWILTGLSPDYTTPGKAQRPMGFAIEPGTVHLGYRVAHTLGAARGDEIEILGRKFSVATALSAESGSIDDLRIFARLDEVQALTGLSGRISEIEALDCSSPACLESGVDPAVTLEGEVRGVLPDARVIVKRSLLETRARQRRLVESVAAWGIPLLVGVASLWIAALTLLNVRERRSEIGVLRALGRTRRFIALVFLLRAAAIGLVGAVTGWISGSLVAMLVAPALFEKTASAVVWSPWLLAVMIVAAPLFAMVAALLPAMIAATDDPAVTLRAS